MNEVMCMQRPCVNCRQRQCAEKDCAKWQVWFLESWAGINQYAWAIRDEMGREEPKNFCYELPHMVKSPCVDCMCEKWCDTPCSLRIKWWDARIGRMRKRGGGYAAR